MVWPAGFVKTHQKEILEYRSNDCLHNAKFPYIPVKLQGGVIIDLGTTEIEKQVSQLLETDELAGDADLCRYLDEKVRSLKNSNSRRKPLASEGLNLLESSLVKQLPVAQQNLIQNSLHQRT